MIGTRSEPKSREGAWLWLYKIVAGLMIVVLLGLHLVINHLVAPGGLLTYADVVRYYQNPIIPVIEVLFLVFVVSHALVGLRSIVMDLHPSGAVLRVVDWLLVLLGSGSIIYGVWLILVIVQKGAAG
jgi:succinate dehydrogenase hydrophobic anchor subunit